MAAEKFAACPVEAIKLSQTFEAWESISDAGSHSPSIHEDLSLHTFASIDHLEKDCGIDLTEQKKFLGPLVDFLGEARSQKKQIAFPDKMKDVVVTLRESVMLALQANLRESTGNPIAIQDAKEKRKRAKEILSRLVPIK